jgi:hypothetical protein
MNTRQSEYRTALSGVTDKWLSSLLNSGLGGSLLLTGLAQFRHASTILAP